MTVIPGENMPASITTVTKDIVIIDQDPAIRLVLQKLLGRFNYQTTALASANDWQNDLTDNTRLIIMDVGYPGIAEQQLMQSIKKQHRHIPVIAMTAFSNLIRPWDMRAMGADAYLTKPFEIGELKKTVSAFL